ncbi:ubiquitin-associated protein 1-like, partial [Clarias magur]
MYAFSLENWVLTGMQGGYGVPSAHPPSVTSKAATCPPYRMMFSSPQQSRLAGRWSSDFWEPNPLRRSRSLNAAHLHVMNDTVKFKISDSDEDESPDNEEASFVRLKCNSSGLKRQELDGKDLLNLPSELHSSILQCSFPRLKARGGKLWKIQDDGDSFHELSSPSLNSSVPLAPTRPLGSHATVHDLSVELLSALSPEERELLQAVTQHGYSLRTAIVALQKTGHRSPDQILSYLVACDHLCELGYDKIQVEEALEMFQNCEKK